MQLLRWTGGEFASLSRETLSHGHACLQVEVLDRYENLPRHEDGLLEGFAALYHYVHEGNGTRALLHQEPLRELPLQFFGRELTFFEPSAWEPGLVGANVTLTRTGVYEVTVLYRQHVINGTPFNLTVVAGPPDAGQTTMQVTSFPAVTLVVLKQGFFMCVRHGIRSVRLIGALIGAVRTCCRQYT